MPLLGKVDGTRLTSAMLMSRVTGQSISDTEHLSQSIVDILTTPIGSRVMRRDYGSDLFFLIDKPINRGTIMRFQSAVIPPLAKWEPRLYVSKLSFDIEQIASGILGMTLEGYYLIQSNVIRLPNLTLDFFKDNPEL
jgi:uncharacterized protein